MTGTGIKTRGAQIGNQNAQKNKRPRCKECGKLLVSYRAKFCKKHSHILKKKVAYCKICGKKLSLSKYTYCRKHSQIERKTGRKKSKCEICGKLITFGYSRCSNHRITTEKARENMRLAAIKRVEEGTWKNQYGGHKTNRSLLQRYGDDNKDRRSSAYRDWRSQVLKRDNFKCRIANQDCSGKVIVHHILSWRDYPELRYNINNGITLCQAHHPRKRAEEKRLIPFFQGLVPVLNVRI